jgi:hypothetical protein
MTRPTAPDGSALSRKHVAHFLATVEWAGVTLEDCGGRLVVRGDRGGLLQAEVDKRAGAIRAWLRQAGHGVVLGVDNVL